MKYGVPPGGILGTLLFLLYINDLKNVIGQSNCRIIMYADDTNIFIACDTIDDVTTVANIYLGKVESYMASNLLHINLDKNWGRKYMEREGKTLVLTHCWYIVIIIFCILNKIYRVTFCMT